MWIAGLAASVLLAFVFLYIGFPHLNKILDRGNFLNAAQQSGFVYLTFDDGPDPTATPRILEILEKAGVKATFFLVGENVEAHPELANRIVQQGHEVGEHSYEHTHAWKTEPFRSAQDVFRGGEVLKRVKRNGRPTLFRPPYGKLNLATLVYVWSSGRRLAWWNVDPRDYECETGQQIADFVNARIAPGAIILLHDGRRRANASTEPTIAALPLILAEIERRGLKPATLNMPMRL